MARERAWAREQELGLVLVWVLVWARDLVLAKVRVLAPGQVQGRALVLLRRQVPELVLARAPGQLQGSTLELVPELAEAWFPGRELSG
jgi:hypothetical protein